MSAQARIILAFILLTSVVLGGTAGFMGIEGWTFGDSLYMAVITVSTVGFGEVRPLSGAGRALAVVIIVFAVASLGYSATAIGAYLAEGHLLLDFRRKRMERAIRRLRDHYIICGGGRFGREVAAEFSRSDAPYVVVDLAPEECELAGFKDAVFVQGDAGNDEALQAARVDSARGLVSALPADDANLFVVLTARQLNPKLTIITQATRPRSIDKLRLAGADRVVSPYRLAGHSMASALLRPAVVNFIDVAQRERTGLRPRGGAGAGALAADREVDPRRGRERPHRRHRDGHAAVGRRVGQHVRLRRAGEYAAPGPERADRGRHRPTTALPARLRRLTRAARLPDLAEIKAKARQDRGAVNTVGVVQQHQVVAGGAQRFQLLRRQRGCRPGRPAP